MEAFNTLDKVTDVKLECDLVSSLHHQLVQVGDFITSEQLVENAAKGWSLLTLFITS